MSVTALVSGKLGRDPERRTSKTGRSFATALIKEGEGDAVTWWKIVIFSDGGIEELLTLKAGDGVAASGTFKAEIYEKDAKQRISFSLVADRIITAKRQKREKEQPEPQRQEPWSDRFDDRFAP